MSSMTWQEWTELGDIQTVSVATACAANGDLYLFALRPPFHYRLYKARQSGTEPFAWSDWVHEESGLRHLVTAERGADDRVLVFLLDYHGWAARLRETGPGSFAFSGVSGLGGTNVQHPLEMVASRLADGRVLCLMVTQQHTVVAKVETAPGTGTFESSLLDLGHWIKDLTVTHRWDGRLEIFGIGSDQSLQHISERASGFGQWRSLGGSFTKIAAASHEEMIYIYGVGTDGKLWELSNDGPSLSWGSWRRHGGRIRDVSVTIDANGEPIVAAVDDRDRLWTFTPGYHTADLAQITQGDPLRINVTGLGLANVADIELRDQRSPFTSIFESITLHETTTEMLRFDLPGERSRAIEPGRYEYTLRLTGAQGHRSHTVQSAFHVRSAPEAPAIDSIGFEAPEAAPNRWTQGDVVTVRIQGTNLAEATDVLHDGESLFGDDDPLDPQSPVHFIDRSDPLQLLLGLSAAWTLARAPGELRFALTIVGAQGHHSAPLHASATVLAATQTPTITRVGILPAGATPPETPPAEDTWTQGDGLVVTIEGQGVGTPQDVVFADGRSVLAEPDTAIIAEQSNDQALVISMGAAATRAHAPGSHIWEIAVIGSQGHRSALSSRDTRVEPLADVTPHIDAVSITPVGAGTADSWTPGDALRITIEGVNLQGAQDVRVDGSTMLDAHTTIDTDSSNATTLVLSMASERTLAHTPGRMTLDLTVVGAQEHHSDAYRFEGFVSPHPAAPRVHSVAEAPVG